MWRAVDRRSMIPTTDRKRGIDLRQNLMNGPTNAPRLSNLQISSAAASKYRQRNRLSLRNPSQL
jgi:hypothetical protein